LHVRFHAHSAPSHAHCFACAACIARYTPLADNAFSPRSRFARAYLIAVDRHALSLLKRKEESGGMPYGESTALAVSGAHSPACITASARAARWRISHAGMAVASGRL